MFRLGPYGRTIREYSIHQRRTGIDAGDVQEAQRLLELGVRMGIVAVLLSKEAQVAASNVILMAFAYVMKQLYDLRRPRLCVPEPIPRVDIHFESFNAAQYWRMFGFTRADCEELFDCLQIPQRVVLNDPASRHAFRVSGVYAFLYTLFHFRSPSERMDLDQQQWGYDCSVLSKMVSAMEELIDDGHRFRLRRLPEAVTKFAEIKAKILERWSIDNMPPHALHCALFADGSRFRSLGRSARGVLRRQVVSLPRRAGRLRAGRHIRRLVRCAPGKGE
jgi:hypothetical protein